MTLRKAALAALLAAPVAAIGLSVGLANASPYGPDMPSGGGNCGSGGGFGSGGGYCDSAVDEFGNQYHCESVYVLGIGGTNCFWRHVG